MKEKLVIPASLKLKGLGITCEEKSWTQLCDSLGVSYKGQSAHRLVKTKYPEVHDAICKDCIYDKAKPVKAGKPSKAKPVKAKEPVLACMACGRELGKIDQMALTLISGTVSKGIFTPDGTITKIYCPYCVLTMLVA